MMKSLRIRRNTHISQTVVTVNAPAEGAGRAVAPPGGIFYFYYAEVLLINMLEAVAAIKHCV